jgi:magnesium chelatase family protein
MLARVFSHILPPLSDEDILEVTGIHSVVGLLDEGLVTEPPFRAPHHTASYVSLIGGGANIKPGEVTLAHKGVLFLDEFPEFEKRVLESLRQPLEDNIVSVSRAKGSAIFPSNFILVAAMNPCPCGMMNPALGCRCKPNEVRKYRGRVSGPLLDRIDLHVEVPHLTQEELLAAPCGEPSAKILERVVTARATQAERFAGLGFYCNAHMTSKDLQKYCRIGAGEQMLLRHAINDFHLSPRAYDRILKVSRTIADLAQSPDILEEHLFEAINYRNFDRGGENW